MQFCVQPEGLVSRVLLRGDIACLYVTLLRGRITGTQEVFSKHVLNESIIERELIELTGCIHSDCLRTLNVSNAGSVRLGNIVQGTEPRPDAAASTLQSSSAAPGRNYEPTAE